MESQPQNPEFRNNPENFHPCTDGNCYSSPCIPYKISEHRADLIFSFFLSNIFIPTILGIYSHISHYITLFHVNFFFHIKHEH